MKFTALKNVFRPFLLVLLLNPSYGQTSSTLLHNDKKAQKILFKQKKQQAKANKKANRLARKAHLKNQTKAFKKSIKKNYKRQKRIQKEKGRG